MAISRGNPRLRALHTSPDAPAVDLFIDGTLTLPNLTFGEVSDYVSLESGNHSLRVFPAGAGGQGRAIFEAELQDLTSGEDYTAVVLGMAEQIHATLLHDTTGIPSAGHAKVRFVHASPDAPAVDVVSEGESVLFSNVGFGQVTDFVEVPSAMVDLEVRPAGKTNSVMVLPDLTLAEGSIYSFVALGLLEGQPGFMVMPLITTVEMRLPA